jgi:RNA polymerase sigma factor (TIGR02999 family)
MPGGPDDVTQLLQQVRGGDPAATARLMEVVYDELRTLAGQCFRGQPECNTLQPTALVHEVFLRLTRRTDIAWEDRAHFFAVCATAMRGILADYARRRAAAKRGGNWTRIALSGLVASGGDPDVIALDEALTRLAAINERQSRVVEYRFFSGLTIEEVACVLGVSKRTVDDDWAMARSWLCVQLGEGEGPP